MSIEYRVYDKIQKKYRTDLIVDSEGRVLLLEVNKRERMHNMHFTVEYGFRGIFEGDIIKTNRGNRTGTIEFNKYMGLFTRNNGIFTESLFDLFHNKRKVEVIGNIHFDSTS